MYRVFPHSSVGKESACNVRDLGSIPGLGRSPGEGNGPGLSCCLLCDRTAGWTLDWACLILPGVDRTLPYSRVQIWAACIWLVQA